MSAAPLNVLLDLRPALDGHAGIPQETRLLFCGLSRLPGVVVDGLLQSSNRVLAKGLAARSTGLSVDRRINRLSRVIVSLQAGVSPTRLESAAAMLRYGIHFVAATVATVLFVRRPLTRFEPQHFRDFVWRALFAKTLTDADFDVVTAAAFRVLRTPWTLMHLSALLLRKSGRALYPRLDTRDFDIMIAETPYPGRVSRGTRLVVRYHDAIPLLMPHTISDKSYHQASHYHALRRNVDDGAWFACVSDATRRDLLSVFPQVEARAVTVHNIVSHHYFFEDSPRERVPDILRTRTNAALRATGGGPAFVFDARPNALQYVLMVSTIEPRKNHLTLLSAWEMLRFGAFPNLQLVLVGSLGWDHRPIVGKLRPWLARGGLHMLEDVPAAELRQLYRHASATVCPSYGEGFDFSGVEAMRCGSVVIASDIPVHRDIYDDAAEFFGTYSPGELADALARLLAPAGAARRESLLRAGDAVARRYLAEAVLPQWAALLNRMHAT